jgi:hypothetical protein
MNEVFTYRRKEIRFLFLSLYLENTMELFPIIVYYIYYIHKSFP